MLIKSFSCFSSCSMGCHGDDPKDVHEFLLFFSAAPEVLKSRGYNRSLDMWSVGVIIYVR